MDDYFLYKSYTQIPNTTPNAFGGVSKKQECIFQTALKDINKLYEIPVTIVTLEKQIRKIERGITKWQLISSQTRLGVQQRCKNISHKDLDVNFLYHEYRMLNMLSATITSPSEFGGKSETFPNILENMIKSCDIPTTINTLEIQIHKIERKIEKWKTTNRLRKQVLHLKTIYQPEQKSQDWYDVRKTMFTASSDIGVITGDAYEHKKETSKEGKEYLKNKLLLKKCGHDLEQFKGSDLTRYGNKFEEVVSKIYQAKNKVIVEEFGILPHPDFPFVGASPDGITPTGKMIEIKCPQRRKITGEVPRYYWSQIQVQLAVCDLIDCDFVECVFLEITEDELYHGTYEYAGALGELYECFCKLSESCNNPSDRCQRCKCYENPDNRKYIYPELGDYSLQISDIKATYNNEYLNTHKFSQITFWALNEYSSVLVKRDREWWDKYIPEVENMWKKVLELRKNPKKLLKTLESAKKYKSKHPSEYEEVTIINPFVN